MASTTQIVCLHEGKKGRSIDPVFINTLLKTLRPAWIRYTGSNIVRLHDCGGRTDLINQMPSHLKTCLAKGGNTTLMVWADLDHDIQMGDQLRNRFWLAAQQAGITKEDFDLVVFAFAKDRLENWIEFLVNGHTDESKEGVRQKHNKWVADAARKLANRCQRPASTPQLPPSLEWSCQNWRELVERMKR